MAAPSEGHSVLLLAASTAPDHDAFIGCVIAAAPGTVLEAVRGHGAALRKPPRSVSKHPAALELFDLVRTPFLLRPHEGAI